MPAFKPLTVAVCALLAPLEEAAPEVWVIVARAGMVLAVILAFRLGRDLGGTAAGVAAAAGVALCGDLIGYSAAGAEPGWTIAFALAGIEAWRADRPRAALACGVACALLRVEAWPFLLVFGLMLWRRRPEDRALLVACAAAIPALWFVPELLGSGDVLRSGARARVPNPGQPALSDLPALASLWAAAKLLLIPLWIGVVLALRDRSARLVAAAGGAWVLLVAAMAEAGFSGEPRYALPGVALLAIAGAAGLARVAFARRVVVGVAVVAAAVPAVVELRDVRDAQAHQWALARDLGDAVAAAGGREAVLACGRPYVGRYRGPLMAYALEVAKRTVEPDLAPRAPGVVFRARLTTASAPAPEAGPPFREAVRVGEWEVLRNCSSN